MWSNAFNLRDIGEFIREARKEQGYTQERFARIIGASHATLSNIEQGKPASSRTVLKALGFLNMRLIIVPRTARVKVDINDA